VGCDPEGLELQLGRTGLRLPFRKRVHSPAELSTILKQLTASAAGSSQ
jgi:hypothetical protein